MHVRAGTVNDAMAIVRLNLAHNEYGGWFRNPLSREDPSDYEELTPFQRVLHGGYWMDEGVLRRHIHEYITRGHPLFVAEMGGKIIGECELWIADEGRPFGKYAEVEMITSDIDSDREQVETELLRKCEERCRKLGIANLDVCPEHSGGVLDYGQLGFDEIWDTRGCEAEIESIEEPDSDFTIEKLPTEFSSTTGFQPWDHREPARLRFELMAGVWPPWKIAGGDRHESCMGSHVKVESPALEFIVQGWRPDWLPKPTTEVNIWSRLDMARKKKSAQLMVKCAATANERLGKGLLKIFVPKQSLPAMRELGFKGGEKPDPWLRKKLE